MGQVMANELEVRPAPQVADVVLPGAAWVEKDATYTNENGLVQAASKVMKTQGGVVETDTRIAPWYLVRSDDKRTARLNTIAHLLSMIPYKKLPHTKVKLPKLSKKGAYDDQASIAKRRFVKERY